MDTEYLTNHADDAWKTVLTSLGVTEKSLDEDVEKLKQWMKSQPHLPEVLDDHYIRNFLILNKCSIEVAKQKIDMYYTIKTLIPDMYEQINPKLSNMKEFMDIVYFVPLPKLTKEMYRVIIMKMRDATMIDKMEPVNLIRFCINMQEIRLKEDVMYGDIWIFDWKGTNMGYMVKLTPTFLAKTFFIYEKVYSIRMKALYFVNTPAFVNNILSTLKRLLKPKIFERIYSCQDTSILNKCIPKEILPKDFGGDENSLEELQKVMKKKFSDNQNRFDNLDQMRVNENLRPEKLKNDEVLGFHGNFKMLECD